MASTVSLRRLPLEVLSLICSELGDERDFPTLYASARACKSLADPALRYMYRYHEDSPAFNDEDVYLTGTANTTTFQNKLAATENAMRRQSNVWRSIILSTQNATFKPYCVYIRVLDFRNLSRMLEDYKFVHELRSDFFAGKMEQYSFKQTPTKKKGLQHLDIRLILDAIGSAITMKSLYLEELDGELNHDLLPSWISHIPHLQSMTLYRGDALSAEAGIAVQKSAKKFKNLTMLEWRNPDADEVFTLFLKNLNPNSLEYFEMIGSNRLGELSFDALATQSRSLRELKLNDLTAEAMKNLHKLRPCSSIVNLSLQGPKLVMLELHHNTVFMEVVAWLSACDQLRDVSLKNFFDGPAIFARVLLSENVKLERLSLEGYELQSTSAAAFHAALPHQHQLETLELKGSGEDVSIGQLEDFVCSLCDLPQLKTLRLKDISEEFEEMHIADLARNLPMLEDFWTSGQLIGPAILPVLAGMKHLKTLNLYALTQFPYDAILDFISRLDKTTQRGFNLNIMAQENAHSLTADEEAMIRQVLAKELEGRCEFVVWRDEEWENSDDD